MAASLNGAKNSAHQRKIAASKKRRENWRNGVMHQRNNEIIIAESVTNGENKRNKRNGKYENMIMAAGISQASTANNISQQQ